MPELSIVKSPGSVVKPAKRRRPTLYRVLANRLKNWQPSDYNDEFLNLLEMIRDAEIPTKYQKMMVRAVVSAYIQFDQMDEDEKDQVVDAVESLDGRELVAAIYESSSPNSRRYILLNHLSNHFSGGGL